MDSAIVREESKEDDATNVNFLVIFWLTTNVNVGLHLNIHCYIEIDFPYFQYVTIALKRYSIPSMKSCTSLK